MERTEVTYIRAEVAAQLCGITVERLRRLERLGIVGPARREGSRRLYGQGELATLRKVRRLTDDLGVNLAGVEIILRLAGELEELRRAERDRRG